MKTFYKNRAFYVLKGESGKKWIFFEVHHDSSKPMKDLHLLPREILREADVHAFSTKKAAELRAYEQTNKMINEHIKRNRTTKSKAR